MKTTKEIFLISLNKVKPNQKWYSEEELKKILNDYRVNKEDIKSLPRYSKHYNDAIDDIYYALFGEEYKQ